MAGPVLDLRAFSTTGATGPVRASVGLAAARGTRYASRGGKRCSVDRSDSDFHVYSHSPAPQTTAVPRAPPTTPASTPWRPAETEIPATAIPVTAIPATAIP